jgi:hypothetical protein
MSRTIIEVHPTNADCTTFAVWLFAPPSAEGELSMPFPYSATDPIPMAFHGGSGAVTEIGEYIVKALFQHDHVKQAIEALLLSASGSPQQLLVRIAEGTETMPWETMFTAGSFLALNPRTSIARMSLQAEGATCWDFQPPLRILAILAADNVDATSEWTELLNSLESAPFAVSVKALVAQDELKTRIASTKSRIVSAEADFVPPGRQVLEVIKAYRPNILHFFCHGLMRGGSFLQIGTRLSHIDAGAPVLLTDADLREAKSAEMWLATLNCCRGAQAADGAASLVFKLMAAGIPAVAGMREPVSETDANLFTGGFYRALMGALGPIAAQPGQEVEVDWPAMMYEPRMDLCEAHRGNAPCPIAALTSREWTLPVMYLRLSSFLLRGIAPSVDTPPIGPVTSKIPKQVVGLFDGLRLKRGAAPALTDEERTARQTELQLLRQLLSQDLGAPPEALEAYRRRIQQLEGELFGAGARTRRQELAR